ncbi:sigma-70 family RNA polymerase sigma factor [Leptospira sp. GIMC2001]|uniref:sigma-70 family RNA polymerase sigma factor n=1 Tax=Leptospira sp. GIMC2001 TaxID=1513297 RepID=UPI00234A6E04|nr:sigma-70 family RNA polymerase sigma factor [Leptospira sp. GIMC2001]WCL47583.1 sigma-70 family RNA polymerase sigma factor [Leptospira sp. GIMC2001]
MLDAKSGNEDSYKKLLSELANELEAILNKKIYSSDDREDLLQEILLSIHKARHSYDTSRKFRPWFNAIVHHKIIDYIRFYTKSQIIDYVADELEYLPKPEEFDHSEQLQAIRDAIRILPSKQKIVIELLKIQGKSIKETAIITGMSISAVKVTSHRGIINLKKALNRNE